MADPNSLYHEIKKLIQVRRAHPALWNKGEITYVYAEENSYPFAYVRTSHAEDPAEKVLVVINPSGQDTFFESELEIKEVIYSYGAEAYARNGKIVAPACSASFLRL
jgi:maltose alpha-D-glucosyltransferase/alpha-amylase